MTREHDEPDETTRERRVTPAESRWLQAVRESKERAIAEHAQRREMLARLDGGAASPAAADQPETDQPEQTEHAAPPLAQMQPTVRYRPADDIADVPPPPSTPAPAPEPAPQRGPAAAVAAESAVPESVPEVPAPMNSVPLPDPTPSSASRDPRPRRWGRFHSAAPAAEAQSPAPGNPFLPAAPTSSEEEGGDDALGPVMSTGPARPTGAPAPADPVLQAPDRFVVHAVRPEVTVQVVGLHGGAGTSTVASQLGAAALDCGVGLAGLSDPTIPVVLVARTHARGLNLVRRVAAQWASGGLDDIRLLGIVFVDDAPALSKLLDRDLRSAERALPHAWRIRWSDELRHSIELPGEATGGKVRRTRKSLLDQAHKLTTETHVTTAAAHSGRAKRGTA